MIYRLSLAAALAALLIGCGGSSGTDGGGSANPSVSIRSSATTISYGDPVTITWNSSNADEVHSNFGIQSSQLNGSFTDTPTSDTTYSIEAKAGSKPSSTKSVVVHVAKANKRILLVADETQPWASTVEELLQSTTSAPLAISLTLPSSFSADTLILTNASLSTSDWPKVKSFLSAGGGVVIIGHAANLLATGDQSNDDLSAIGNVLAGATERNDYTEVNVVNSAQPGFPLSATTYGVILPGINQISPVSVNAIRLSTAANGAYDAFAYRPPIGGRVAYLNTIGVDASESSLALQQLFLAETRWVAG
jgi:hypothetical protein